MDERLKKYGIRPQGSEEGRDLWDGLVLRLEDVSSSVLPAPLLHMGREKTRGGASKRASRTAHEAHRTREIVDTVNLRTGCDGVGDMLVTRPHMRDVQHGPACADTLTLPASDLPNTHSGKVRYQCQIMRYLLSVMSAQVCSTAYLTTPTVSDHRVCPLALRRLHELAQISCKLLSDCRDPSRHDRRHALLSMFCQRTFKYRTWSPRPYHVSRVPLLSQPPSEAATATH